MGYGAIDLHMRYSQIWISDEAGVVQRDQRIPTSREQLTQAFAGHGPMRILLETGTESEWVAQAVEAVAHEVIVADPETKQILRSRRLSVQMRSGAVGLLRSLLRQWGYRLGTGSCDTVPARGAGLTIPTARRLPNLMNV